MSNNKSNNSSHRKGLQEQIKSFFPAAGKRVELPSIPSMWEEDGEDHINVHWSGKTELGKRRLPMAAKLFRPVNNPILGEFDTLLNLWGFVRAANPDDRMRKLQTKALFSLISETGGNFPAVVNAKALLFEAAYLTYMQNTQIAEALMKNTLPFDMYNTTEAVMPTRDKNAIWHSMSLTEISNALREGRNPNFFFLLDRAFIETHGLREEDYKVEHAYQGVVERWVGGKLPSSIVFADIYNKAREHMADDISKRASALAKKKEAFAAPVVEAVAEVPVEEAMEDANAGLPEVQGGEVLAEANDVLVPESEVEADAGEVVAEVVVEEAQAEVVVEVVAEDGNDVQGEPTETMEDANNGIEVV